MIDLTEMNQIWLQHLTSLRHYPTHTWISVNHIFSLLRCTIVTSHILISAAYP